MARLRLFGRSMAYGVGALLLKGLVLTTPAAAQDLVKVLALGDSLTAGYGLPEGQGFVPVLQDWLSERGHAAEVINAGVSGDTTAGGRARLDWALAAEPDAAIVALGGNDLLRGLPPEVSRENLDAILSRLSADEIAALLVGLEAPGNFGPAFKASFDAMYPELAEEYGALHEVSFLAPLVRATGGDIGAARAQYIQADGIHPNAEGVKVIVETIGPRVVELLALARD